MHNYGRSMMVHIDNCGAIGIIKDIPEHELDIQAWSNGANVRFYDGIVEKIKGHEPAFSSTDTPTIAIRPYWLHPVQSGTSYFWLYAGTSEVHATDGTTKKSISGSSSFSNSISASAGSWSGGALGEIVTFTNGQNEPYQWGSINNAPDLGVPLIHLQNWPASTICRILKPFREFLVAMDISESAQRNRRLVRWSHPAVPGTVPSSWDYTDRTKLAGRVELSGDQYPIVDGAQLRDSFMIYKDHSIWEMRYIGLPEVMAFRKSFGEIGVLAKNCVVEVQGQHVVFGDGDIVIHDGQAIKSVLRSRMRRWLYNNIDTTYFHRSFVTMNLPRSEVWFCYCQTGADASEVELIQPDKALVWNWKDNTTSIVELPGVSAAAIGIVNSGAGSSTFDAQSGTFDSDSAQFDELLYQLQQHKTIIATPSAPAYRLHVLDSTEYFNGAGMNSYVERLSLPLERVSDTNQRKPDISTIKHVRAVYPRISGTVGGVVDVYVGRQDVAGGTVTWSGPYSFTIGTSYKVDTRVKGRLIGVKFQTNSLGFNWSLSGYSLDVDVDGKR